MGGDVVGAGGRGTTVDVDRAGGYGEVGEDGVGARPAVVVEDHHAVELGGVRAGAVADEDGLARGHVARVGGRARPPLLAAAAGGVEAQAVVGRVAGAGSEPDTVCPARAEEDVLEPY